MIAPSTRPTGLARSVLPPASWPRLRGRWAAIGLPVATVAALALQSWQLYRGMARAAVLARTAHPFETHPPRSRARVLLLGDSTGVGVGTERAEDTIAGLLAREHPAVEIVNRCRNGARLTDAIAQCEPLLRRASAGGACGQGFDLVLLFVGGNDVLRHASARRLVRDARELLLRVRQLGRRAVWLGSANIGGSPLLFPPFSWWMGWRTDRAMRRLAREAEAFGVDFIDFVRHGREDLFAQRADLYFAPDGVHPSAASYRHCYAVLKARVQLDALLRRRPAPVAVADPTSSQRSGPGNDACRSTTPNPP